MDVFLAVLGATGVVVAMAANFTNIARYVGERRRAAKSTSATSSAPLLPDPAVEPAPVTAAATPPSEVLATAVAPSIVAAAFHLARPRIRTPDQRLRVFVSSTLHELAEERAAARRAIESLRLTPVMFELGARSHAPRDLYRAYLAQSDVFIAIYGQRYGWVAPGETISGLEDEYTLSRGLPRLVYVRDEVEPREARLEGLLERVRADDATSYKPFRSAEELGELLGNDLAVLLSERFTGAGGDLHAAAPASVAASLLPAPLTSFVGRAALLDEVAGFLLRPEVRLLTLYGPGGAGKSRLAIEVAARLRGAFADDVIYVSLAAVRDPDLVASSLAIGLGVREAVGVSTVRAVQDALARRAGLLVVDNFEHLVDAAPVIADVLQAAPALTVLVTSRSLLRLSGEVAFPVPPLDLPAPGAALEALQASEAVRLFVERARAVDPHFVLDADNATAVVEICRRVDALPLAIELAAARVRSMPPSALLARMTRRLPLLTGGPRDAPARQRTLRDTIDWSVALLGDGERALFGRLSLFDGGGSLSMVERVLPEDGALLEDLTSLVDKSLVQRQGEDDEDRVVMLETVREYAAERFADDPEAGALRDRHAHAFLDLAEQGAVALKGRDQARWLDGLVRDLGNFRAAMSTLLARGAAEEALRLATALRPLFMSRCHYAEGRRLLRLALDASGEVRGGVRAAGLLALGALVWREGDLAASLPPLEESLSTYRAIGDGAGEAATLRLLGVHAHNAGDYDLAQHRLEASVAAMRGLGDDEGVANALLSLGNVAFDRADPRARELYDESRAIAERIGDTLGVAYAVDNLSVLAWCRGDLRASERATAEAEALYERLEHPFGAASVLHRRGLLAFARHDLARSAGYLAQSLQVRDEIGEGRGAAFVRYDLARVALADGRGDEAVDHLRKGLDLASRHGAPLVLVLYLEGVAALQATRGDLSGAVALSAAAAAWRRAAGVPICRINEEAHEELAAELRRRLEPAAWDAAEALGRGWGVAEAVERARALIVMPSGRAAGSATGRGAPPPA
jgi:predicted ATPase